MHIVFQLPAKHIKFMLVNDLSISRQRKQTQIDLNCKEDLQVNIAYLKSRGLLTSGKVWPGAQMKWINPGFLLSTYWFLYLGLVSRSFWACILPGSDPAEKRVSIFNSLNKTPNCSLIGPLLPWFVTVCSKPTLKVREMGYAERVKPRRVHFWPEGGVNSSQTHDSEISNSVRKREGELNLTTFYLNAFKN